MNSSKRLVIFVILVVFVLFVSGCAEQESAANTTETVKETETCTPDWVCGEWSVCAEGVQTRTCTDANNCGSGDKPAETQACTEDKKEEIKEETGPKEEPKIFVNAPNGFDYYNYIPHNETIEVSNAYSDVHLLYKFPILGSPMPYYIYNTTEVNRGYFDSTAKQIKSSIGSWEKASNYKVKFQESDTMPDYGIKIEITSEAVSEEASAQTTKLDNYTLITGGNMKIQGGPSSDRKTFLIIHGIGHIFGFDHSSRQVSVMYPEYVAIPGSKQMITTDLNTALKKLYRDVPRSE